MRPTETRNLEVPADANPFSGLKWTMGYSAVELRLSVTAKESRESLSRSREAQGWSRHWVWGTVALEAWGLQVSIHGCRIHFPSEHLTLDIFLSLISYFPIGNL